MRLKQGANGSVNLALSAPLWPPLSFFWSVSWYSAAALLQLRLSYLNLHSDGERDRAGERESEIDNTGHSPMTTLKGIWGEERRGEEERRAAAQRCMDFCSKLGPWKTCRLNK